MEPLPQPQEQVPLQEQEQEPLQEPDALLLGAQPQKLQEQETEIQLSGCRFRISG